MELKDRITLSDSSGMRETYIVSGHPRSGTSMMMHALITGGLTGAYSGGPTPGSGAYHPNPNGYFELREGEQQEPDHPTRFQGDVLKAIYGILPQLAPGNYKVVYMLRRPEEIRKSSNRIGTGRRNRLQRREADTDEQYFSRMGRYLSIASLRPDMDVLQVWYHDVISNPVGSFERIRDFGIPIDPEMSAKIVNPKLYRNRSDV